MHRDRHDVWKTMHEITGTNVHTYTCTYVCMYTRTHIDVCMHVCSEKLKSLVHTMDGQRQPCKSVEALYVCIQEPETNQRSDAQ